MAKAYILAFIDVHDWETYDRYRAGVPGVIARYGGRFIMRGPPSEVVEGDWPGSRVVCVEFPDEATARRFYDSPEYQEILPHRLKATSGRLLFVPGVD